MDLRHWIMCSSGCVLLLAGCPKEDASGVSRARSGVRPLVEAACSWMYECCSDGELKYQVADFTVDAGNCTERMLDALATGQPLALVQGDLSDNYAQGLLVLARSLNEGRVDVRPGAVDSCAGATQARACNAPVEVEPNQRCTPAQEQPENPCDPNDMFIGQQDVGEECEGPWECREGLRCITYDTIGICAAAALRGETCYTDGECVTGLICDFATGTCDEGAALNETCAFNDPENPIPGTESIRCAPGLSCDPDSLVCTGGFCAPGSRCTDLFGHRDCPEGLFCIGDPNANEGTCRQPADIGTPCVSDEACSSGFCHPFDEVCGQRVPAGQNCMTHAECQTSYCAGNICEDQVANGQPCPNFENAQCQNGYCDFSGAQPTCTAYAQEGQPCPNNNECDPEAELVCADGTCAKPPFANGLPCSSGQQCMSGVCYPDICVDGTAIGQPCNTDGSLAPCVIAAFCDTPQDGGPNNTAGTCVELLRPGQSCERSEQCWGECVVRYGELMCDSTPAFALEELWCDGE